jgi:hypothetical protein
MMVTEYHVYGLRVSRGEYTDEGSFNTEDRALARLDALADDSDCVLAEVEYLPAPPGGPKVAVIAQAERIDGEWKRVAGELRTRTRAAEAREILEWARDL